MPNISKIAATMAMWRIGVNELARTVNCSPAYISKFLKGRIPISERFLIRVVEGLEKLIKEKRLDSRYFE